MENLWRIATGQDPNRQDYEGIEFWSNPERSGWLTKQGDYIKTWRRRWFVLKRGKLLWFKDQSAALTRGSIPRGVISVGDCLTVKGAEDVVNKPFAFEISSGNITMFFVADNEKEKEEWINSIGRSIVQHSRSVTDSEVLDYDQRRRLIDQDDRIRVTVLLMKLHGQSHLDTYVKSIGSSQPFVRFIDVPELVEKPALGSTQSVEAFVYNFIERNIALVRDIVLGLLSSPGVTVKGIVADFFCLPMIDITKDVNLPFYVFLTTNSGFLAMMQYLADRHSKDTSVFVRDSGEMLSIPGFVNPVPANVLPSALFIEDGYDAYVKLAILFSKAKGILVNSSFDLEPSSGFLDRVRGRGMICGWSPQVEILAHKAVGSFVSHCGWNSIVESLWFGVPIVTWPMYAEQQLNAFMMVKELKLAVEMKLDYRVLVDELVSANEIETAIRCMMNKDDNLVRKRVIDASQMLRKATLNGGSSYTATAKIIQDVTGIKP
ncbi:hypothetical protein Bca101_018300 [Brassica carinata]